jgi:membrane-bound ClpP family serine protease
MVSVSLSTNIRSEMRCIVQKKLKRSIGTLLLIAGMLFIVVSILAGIGVFTALLGVIFLVAGFLMLPSSVE